MTAAPFPLDDAAELYGAIYTRDLLYREFRAGRLHAFKIGRKLCTSEGDFQDWIAVCRERSSRPDSFSDKAAAQAGLSETAQQKFGQAMALSAARMLRNSSKPLLNTSPSGSSAQRGQDRRRQ